jgi:hypothetical protein
MQMIMAFAYIKRGHGTAAVTGLVNGEGLK